MQIQKDIGRSIAVTYDNTLSPTVDTVLIYKKGVRQGFNGSWNQDSGTPGTLALCLVTLAFNDVDELGDLVVVISSGGNGLGERMLQVVDFNPDNGPIVNPANVWDLVDGIEANITPREAMRAMLAFIVGPWFKDGSGNEVFRNPDTTKDRLTYPAFDGVSRSPPTMDLT